MGEWWDFHIPHKSPPYSHLRKKSLIKHPPWCDVCGENMSTSHLQRPTISSSCNFKGYSLFYFKSREIMELLSDIYIVPSAIPVYRHWILAILENVQTYLSNQHVYREWQQEMVTRYSLYFHFNWIQIVEHIAQFWGDWLNAFDHWASPLMLCVVPLDRAPYLHRTYAPSWLVKGLTFNSKPFYSIY